MRKLLLFILLAFAIVLIAGCGVNQPAEKNLASNQVTGRPVIKPVTKSNPDSGKSVGDRTVKHGVTGRPVAKVSSAGGEALGDRAVLPEYRRSLYRVHTTEKIVALTVDDGPDPRFTPKLLAILQSHHIHATFFLVGKHVLQYPDLARAELQQGNEVGNHTLTHPDLLKEASDREMVHEIAGGARAIQEELGVTPKYFRAPKGLFNQKGFQMANSLGERVIMWTITLEHEACPTPQAMAQRIINGVTPGNIILMHDGNLDRTKSIEAIPIVIDGLQKKGYTFVTLSQLLAADQHTKPKSQPQEKLAKAV